MPDTPPPPDSARAPEPTPGPGTDGAARALAQYLKAEAQRLGFALAGIAPVAPMASHPFHVAWLARDYGGRMGYLHRHAPLKAHPHRIAPWARSVLVLAHPYPEAAPPPPDDTPRGRVSRYAQARDYHDVLHAKLARLAAALEQRAGRPVQHRAFVDTGPLPERELAARAGLGWVGRNAMLIHWRAGSWLFLAELLLELPLPPDVPPPPGRRATPTAARPRPGTAPPLPVTPLALRESCGSCTACIDACPTAAIVADKVVDARRCISYLTIELKGPIPAALRPGVGEWVFGCDVCQEVCPWNRRAQAAQRNAPPEPALQGDAAAAWPALPALLAMDDAAFRARYRDTPLWRPRRRGLLRNAAIALGNAWVQGRIAHPAQRSAAHGALRSALGDPEPLVRGAAAWALGQIGDDAAHDALRAALAAETDPEVRGEVCAALGDGP